MNTDDFEQHLRRQPLRPVPPAWRDEILATARQSDRQAVGMPPAAAGGPSWTAVLRDWLWPHPAAWAGLAAGWVLVAALNTVADAPLLTATGPLPRPAGVWAAAIEAGDDGFIGSAGNPSGPSARPVPAASPRRPGTTWIHRYEEHVV